MQLLRCLALYDSRTTATVYGTEKRRVEEDEDHKAAGLKDYYFYY